VNRSERLEAWLVLAGIAVAVCVLLHEALFLGKGLVPADGIYAHLPWSAEADRPPSNALLRDQYAVFGPQRQFLHDRAVRGELPLWNPHIACGVPNVASMQGAALFPINLLLSPVDPFRAAGIAALVKLALAGIFTALFVRRLGAGPAGALLSGLCFALCGFMVVWLGHPHTNVAMWLPLVFYLIEGALNRAVAWTALAATFGLIFLGGHVPTAIHMVGAASAYVGFRIATDRRLSLFTQAGLFVAAVLAGLLLAAPQLLPFLEYQRESSLDAASAALERWATSLPPSALIHFLLPQASGSPTVGFEEVGAWLQLGGVENYNEHTGYVGITALFLALFAVVFRRDKPSFFFLTLAALCTLVICGVGPIPSILRALPLLRDVNHVRLLLVIDFSLAVLAGLGLDALLRRPERKPALALALGFAVAALVAVTAVFVSSGASLSDLPPAAWRFVRVGLAVLGAGLVVNVVAAIAPKPLAAAVVLLGAVGELLWLGMGYNPAIDRADYYPTTPAIEFLRREASGGRFVGMGTLLLPNTAAVYGLEDVRGTDFATVRRYEELVTGESGDFYFGIRPRPLPPYWALLDVKYALTTPDARPPAPPSEKVYDGEIAIYRMLPSSQRAAVVLEYEVHADPRQVLERVWSPGFDPRSVVLLEQPPAWPPDTTGAVQPSLLASAEVVDHQPDTVTVQASAPGPALLVLLDTWYPGWQATVDGVDAPIYRADYSFRAVPIPAGESLVRFAYRPASFGTGIALSACTAALLALLCARAWRS